MSFDDPSVDEGFLSAKVKRMMNELTLSSQELAEDFGQPPPLRWRGHDDLDDDERAVIEDEEHATDEERDEHEPTEHDLAITHDALWDVEGQGGEMKNLGLTKDTTTLLSSTENAQSQAACKWCQEKHLRHVPNALHSTLIVTNKQLVTHLKIQIELMMRMMSKLFCSCLRDRRVFCWQLLVCALTRWVLLSGAT